MEISKSECRWTIVLVVGLFLICAVLASLGAGLCAAGVSFAATDLKTVGKAAYMIDAASGTVIYARNEKERLPIASMVKIMTSLLTLEAVDRGEASFDDVVTVSEEAAGMGGSQVFLDAGSEHKLGDLLKTVIVASANDSCVALAEHLSGSVSAFVANMNKRAKELGMRDTNFKNCTGLPAAESFSCARDVAVMFGELIKHPAYFNYACIWMEDYMHPSGRSTSISNTNKLVRFYRGCDGGKTGYTSEAKFCLAATAKRDDMRIIAVMIGAPSSKERNAAVSAMFDEAFGNYTTNVLLKAGEPLDRTVCVAGGKKDSLSLSAASDVAKFMSRNDSASYELRFDLPDSVKAPVKRGDKIGSAYLVKDGEILSETDIVANEDVRRMSLFDAIGEIGRHWGTVA